MSCKFATEVFGWRGRCHCAFLMYRDTLNALQCNEKCKDEEQGIQLSSLDDLQTTCKIFFEPQTSLHVPVCCCYYTSLTCVSFQQGSHCLLPNVAGLTLNLQLSNKWCKSLFLTLISHRIALSLSLLWCWEFISPDCFAYIRSLPPAPQHQIWTSGFWLLIFLQIW